MGPDAENPGSMKALLPRVLLSLAPLTACVQVTDFSGEDEDSDTSGASQPNTSVEPTNSGDAQDSGMDASPGETMWTVDAPELPYGQAVAALPDGGFAVALGFDSGVRRFDASGREVWAQVLSSEGEPVFLTAIAPSPDGDVIVLGMILTTHFFTGDLWVGELSAVDGSEQWAARPSLPGTGRGEAIAVDAEGGLRIAGLNGDEVHSDVLMASLAPDGTPEWWHIAQDLSGGDSVATDVVVLPDGSAAFVGVSDLDDPKQWVRRIDAAGQELWTTRFDQAPDRYASIERRGDGTLMVVTSDVGPDGSTRAVVIELDESGVEQARNTWTPDGVTSQELHGSALASDGTLYVAGTTDDTSAGIYGALDPHGGHRWSQLLLPNDVPDAMVQDAAVLADGSVAFVGMAGYATGEGPWHLWMCRTEP